MIFDWDDNKAESNKKKHGVSFAEAARKAVKEEMNQYFSKVKL